MNEFENTMILSDTPFQNGLFIQVPPFRKNGSAFILTGGVYDDIRVDEHTTPRDIRQGKYTRLVEISTLPYMKELQFNASAKEQAYSFVVYVKAVIQVVDPIKFYQNKNLDVDAYFNNLFSIDVKQITRQYSILAYNGLDRELTQKLSVYNNVDIATGFSYQVSVVDAEPGVEAKEFVRRSSNQQLESALRNQSRELAKEITTNYIQAILTEVAEGKLTEAEAISKIDEYKNQTFDTKLKQYNNLLEIGLITEHDLRPQILQSLNMDTPPKNASPVAGSQLDAFFQEGDDV